MNDNTILLPTYVEDFTEKVLRESIDKRLHASDSEETDDTDLIEAKDKSEMITEMADERL